MLSFEIILGGRVFFLLLLSLFGVKRVLMCWSLRKDDEMLNIGTTRVGTKMESM